jgi:hypothetical protein
MPRTQTEIEQYRNSYAEFVQELNGDGTTRYYPSVKNAELLRDAMFALQKQAALQWEELWHARIWSSVYVQNVTKLEAPPLPKTREQIVAERQEQDRRKALETSRRPERLTDEQIEEAEELARQQAVEAATSIVNRIQDNVRKATSAAELEQDQKQNPHKYCTKDFSRDATPEEMRAMPTPVLKFFLKKRDEFKRSEAQQADRDRQALQTLKNLGR